MFVMTGFALGGAAGGGAGSGLLLLKAHTYSPNLEAFVPQTYCLKIRLLNADHHAIQGRCVFHHFEGLIGKPSLSQLLSPLKLRETFLKILYSAV